MPSPAVRAPAAVGQVRQATLRELREDFAVMRPWFAALRGRLLDEYRRGGQAQLERTFRHWYTQFVIVPRVALYRAALERTAARRGAVLSAELARRYGGRRPFHPQSVARGAVNVWTCPRGRTRWSYAQRRLPTDAEVQCRFLAVLQRWRAEQARRARGLTLAAKSEDDRRREWTPRIDPRHAKIAYPIRDDLSDADLVARALDTVVVARGQYFAEVGLRDIIREVDRAVSLIESGRQAVIVGWRWNLSPAHTEELCRSGICRALAETDVGHPHGPGVYFDALVPQSHPNCWCDLDAEWATDDEAADPDWEPPEPDADYEDRVRALVESYGGTMLAAAEIAAA